jgi:hypothetical protein
MKPYPGEIRLRKKQTVRRVDQLTLAPQGSSDFTLFRALKKPRERALSRAILSIQAEGNLKRHDERGANTASSEPDGYTATSGPATVAESASICGRH